MASIRVSPSVERLITDALKRLPVSQTRDQFVEDAVSRYARDLKRRGYSFKSYWSLSVLTFPSCGNAGEVYAFRR